MAERSTELSKKRSAAGDTTPACSGRVQPTPGQLTAGKLAGVTEAAASCAQSGKGVLR